MVEVDHAASASFAHARPRPANFPHTTRFRHHVTGFGIERNMREEFIFFFFCPIVRPLALEEMRFDALAAIGPHGPPPIAPRVGLPQGLWGSSLSLLIQPDEVCKNAFCGSGALAAIEPHGPPPIAPRARLPQGLWGSSLNLLIQPDEVCKNTFCGSGALAAIAPHGPPPIAPRVGLRHRSWCSRKVVHFKLHRAGSIAKTPTPVHSKTPAPRSWTVGPIWRCGGGSGQSAG